MYIKINNGGIEKYPYSVEDIKTDYPNVSFPVGYPEGSLNTFDIFTVFPSPVPFHTYMENVVEGTPTYNQDGSRWEQTWVVQPATQEEIAEREASAKQSNAAEAKQRLLDTDWSQLTDVTPVLLNKAAFDTYRAALRAIVIDPPVTVESWPIRPEAVWDTA